MLIIPGCESHCPVASALLAINGSIEAKYQSDGTVEQDWFVTKEHPERGS